MANPVRLAWRINKAVFSPPALYKITKLNAHISNSARNSGMSICNFLSKLPSNEGDWNCSIRISIFMRCILFRVQIGIDDFACDGGGYRAAVAAVFRYHRHRYPGIVYRRKRNE